MLEVKYSTKSVSYTHLYLHIGSAKAIYINWSIANQYGGKFNLRLDDTNPAREGEEYVNSCLLYTS